MNRPEIILRNSASCLACSDEVESTSRHDCRWCRCGRLGVNGRHAYIRRIGSSGTVTLIIAIREMDGPDATPALDFQTRIGITCQPTSPDYAKAPVLQLWR